MKSETVLPLPPSQFDPAVSMEESEGGLDVGQLLHTLQRKWLLIVGITLATTAVAAAKVLTDTPTYNGTLEILVQPLSAESEVISNIPETLASNAQSPTTTAALNQDLIKILTSPSVLEPVVEEVKTRYPQFCNLPVAEVNNAELADKLCYNSIRRGLQVGAAEKDSNILQVGFQDPDPQKVVTILDAVSDAYLKYSLSSKQADIRRGIDFVNQKLPDLQTKVNTFQERLQNLRLENDLIDPESRGSQLSSQMSAFSQEQLQIEVELQQNRDIYQNLKQQLQQPQETTASSALAENPRYQTLLNSLLELDSQIAEASTIYLDSSPDMQVLKEQRQNLLTLLAQQGQQSEQEIVNKIRELEARDQALKQTIQGLNTDVDNLSGISRSYTDIQRELQVATENLTQFLAKKEALEIDAAQREIPWEIFTPPTDPRPQPVSLPQNLLLGGILGLLLGTGAALLLDKSGGVIHNDDEIRRATRLPVLGRIPNQTFPEIVSDRKSVVESVPYVDAAAQSESNGFSRSNKVLTAQKTSANAYAGDPFSESFRSLYTNIRLLNTHRPIRSVAISSVMPGEGKSTVAIHLAETVAAMGHRVLLVDADLRNPHIHTYLELSNEKGLTNLFSGESNPAVIQKFAPNSSLYVIASGSASFEPTRLFSSKSMRQFVERIESKFDFVIYDTPPLLGQSDAYLIADNTDGLLLVTKPGQLKQSLLDRAMEQLRMANINVLGLVNRER
ncbi:MAG: polysaccharide biosynthesis tyrosine autokinase [Phormidesmis sp.]